MSIIDGVRGFFGGANRITRPVAARSFRMRSSGAGGGGHIFDAAAGHSLMPHYPEIGPIDPIRELRILQRIARAMVKNNAWVKNLVKVICDTQAGTGPIPQSRYPELDDLWLASSEQFDNRGVGSFGRWYRQDVKRNRWIDGETFIRRRTRFVNGKADPKLIVPIQFQALTSDFVPTDSDPNSPYGRKLAGVVFDDRERPVSYTMHVEHPRGGVGLATRTIQVPADEVYHHFDPDTGSPRGEVPLAAALLRAIKLETLDNNELRRKITAGLASMIVEPSVDAGAMDESYIQDEEIITRMIDEIDLVPGGIVRIPNGFKARWETPPDEGANFEKAYRFQLLQICATAGVPLHEVTGEIENLTERMAKYIGLATKRRAEIEQDNDEFQVLNPMRRDWIDAAIASKAWKAPPGARPQDIYACDWSWPVIQQASLTQELNVLMTAEEKGHIPHGWISRNYFGLKPEIVSRVHAKELARAREDGLKFADPLWGPTTDTAKRIEAEAIADETLERDLVEDSLLEDSPHINGTKKPRKSPPKNLG